MKVVIFDIDGVLNRNEWESGPAAWIQSDLAKRFAPLAAEVDLCVCCSARRRCITADLLASHGIAVKRLDKLGEGHWSHKLRLTLDWTRIWLKEGDSFVILDDMNYPHTRQIVINPKMGLTDADVELARSMLNSVVDP